MNHAGKIPCIGLTGGIGSGKSTVANMFSEFGIPVLDLDEVGRDLASQPEHLATLVHAFGDDILHTDGTLDRRELARICFSDVEKTRKLNQIMHPAIWGKAEAWLVRQHAVYALIEASVLIESGGVSRMDDVVVVLADEDVRRERVLAGRGMDAAHFNVIVQQQCDDHARCAATDYVIRNNTDLLSLQGKVEALHHRFVEKYSSDAG